MTLHSLYALLKNRMEHITYIVIGAGAAGLVIANGLAKTNRPVLLIEKDHFGGDCTNFGCVPSKSLIASAHIAHSIQTAEKYGITSKNPSFDAAGVFQRTQNIVEKIREGEEPEALGKNGVRTILGIAEFIDAHTVRVIQKGGTETCFSAKYIVIATGSSPMIPDIPGIFDTPYLTNETIFSLENVPKTIAFLGTGPIGIELAQAFARLGATVHLLVHGDHILSREDSDVQEMMEKVLETEGLIFHRNAHIPRVDYRENQFHLAGISVDALVVAVGRKPNIERLNLDAAGIRHTEKGINADEYGRTSQHHIFAVGDVAGQPFFTHYAENQARTVLTSLLLPWNKKLSKQAIPRTTFTDPEVASVGLSEKAAIEQYGEKKLAIYRIPLTHVDRAITNSEEIGIIKVITKKWSSKIIGATIVAPRAGEMLMEISLAMKAKIPFRKLSDLIHPYPTYGQGIRKAADLYLTQTLLGSLKKK